MDDYSDEELDDIVGAIVRKRSGRRLPSRRPSRRVSQAIRRAQRPPSYMKTRPRAGAQAEFPLGFSTIQFVNGGPTTLVMTGTPQRRGKPNRLTLIEARSAATVVGLVTIQDIKVGTLSQMMSNDPLPAGMFSADAVGTELEIAEVGPGIETTLIITISAAPPAGETLDLAASFICDALD